MDNLAASTGIITNGVVYRNLDVHALSKKSLENRETQESKSGALVVYTGDITGRSPKDRFIVKTSTDEQDVDWGDINLYLDEVHFDVLYKKMTDYLSNRNELYVFDGFAGADSVHKLPVRVVCEYAFQALFATHMLRRPTPIELETHAPELTVLVAPNLKADPTLDGTNSQNFIVLNLEKMIVLIGGTKYSGEIKKSIFTVMNYLLPKKQVFPMHCSANMSKDNTTALFFGLSGTGKTTLSADPERALIGDDEHGWSEHGIFNFEGGCYAKCIDLKQENEPQIFAAIRAGALIENVVLKQDGELDFADRTITENTRVAYPLDYIGNAVASGVGGHPKYIVFLTADAFGLLPPVAKLSNEGAMYHFLSGYTSKLAGTEKGIVAPKATFSSCFGAPFMPRPPLVYAQLLKKYMNTYQTQVYLVNTGWSGGPHGVGSRISIKDTRAIIHAILNGELDNVEYRHDDLFNLDVPISVSNTNTSILTPRNLWANSQEYDETAKHLISLFVENFKKFKNIPEEIISAGPQSV